MSIVPFSRELAQQLLSSGEKFPVDFDVAWQWLGYSRKDSAKTKFTNCGFVEDVDFESHKLQELRPQGGYSNREQIRLTCECLKQWGMMAGTEKGKQIRLYFLECEKIAKLIAQQPKTHAEIMLGMCEQLVQHERSISDLQLRVNSIEAEKQKAEERVSEVKSELVQIKYNAELAEKALKAHPAPEVVTPAMSTRTEINRIVRDYVYATGCDYQWAWRALYREFRDLYHTDLYKLAQNRSCTKLDMCESLGMLKDLYAVAHQLFTEVA